MIDDILSADQLEALSKMRNGCILCGGVGTGKSRTALAYYFRQNGGMIGGGKYRPMKKHPQDLYIITTARKRDTMDWEAEFPPFHLSLKDSEYQHKIVIDSWNNLEKYVKTVDAFFIFDEQRVVGKGPWAKAFKRIASVNNWILLSATPGDTWMDYMQVFIANGFYKNQRDFIEQHVIWAPRVKFPKVNGYRNTGRLIRLRDRILVDINFERHTEAHHTYLTPDYDRTAYRTLIRTRWDPNKNKPIKNAADLCFLLRKLVNSDASRQDMLLDIFEEHSRLIVFYNHDYERDILLGINYGEDVEVAEWTGHKHQPVPESERWIYVVQYTAGSEGWNCITTDTIVFYSQTYSYKTLAQACGRIDRRNTLYRDLYYYHFCSKAGIDLAIRRALTEKKQFNETRFERRLS